MKQFIKKNLNEIIILIVVILVLFGLFYWFSLRPTNIRKDCADESSIEAIVGMLDDKESEYEKQYNFNYKQCLQRNGLKE